MRKKLSFLIAVVLATGCVAEDGATDEPDDEDVGSEDAGADDTGSDDADDDVGDDGLTTEDPELTDLAAAVKWSESILANGSFEKSSFIKGVKPADATALSKWNLYGSYTGACARALRVKGGAKAGNYHMTLLSSGTSTASATQVVPAKAKLTYRAQAWSQAYAPGDASAQRLQMTFLDRNFKKLSTKQIAAKTKASWQRNAVTAVAPSGTKFVRLTLLAKRRSDGGCIDIGFDPTVTYDSVSLQHSLP